MTLGKPGSDERALSDRLYEELQEAGLTTIYDERDAGPGEKFADAELLGCPLRVTVGRRTLQAGELEVQVRRGQEARALPLDGARHQRSLICGASSAERRSACSASIAPARTRRRRALTSRCVR